MLNLDQIISIIPCIECVGCMDVIFKEGIIVIRYCSSWPDGGQVQIGETIALNLSEIGGDK